jgi:DNA helicase-2/ATP-dependent DNA helicase PcrA
MESISRSFLNYYFSSLNPQQKEAVFTINGPVLVLSGAGSGKTTVIVNRIANMILFGDACNYDIYDDKEAYDAVSDYMNDENTDLMRVSRAIAHNPIRPWNILAITFTNKAAGEMRERLTAHLGELASDINASTFHSACARILRYDIAALGYSSNFTIYDTDDVKRLIRACMTELDIDTKKFSLKLVTSEISMAKNHLITPKNYINGSFDAQYAQDNYKRSVIGKIYEYYNQRLKESNALDFDDLLLKTVELFETRPDILEKYQNRYRYILVDEYQDTNIAQYRLVSLLAAKYKNLCVVGDDDQSIYRFRGATIENILSFEKQFDNCKTIKLEQNYRSTQIILDGANSVIKNNEGRKAKALWTSQSGGDKIQWYKAANEDREAEHIVQVIEEGVKNGGKYSDYAVLYRMNAMSNAIEHALFNRIPYKVYGGLRFYDRKEIRDIIAYLSIIANDWDTVRLNRIINEPKRGIGATTVAVINQISRDLSVSCIEIIREADQYPSLSKRAKALKSFAEIIDNLKNEVETSDFSEIDIIEDIVVKTGYKAYMETLGDEGKERLQNIYELKSTLKRYCEDSEEPSLEGFLEQVSLYTDVDKFEEVEDTVSLMTIHSSKGLEFNNVFIAAMEDGIFPSFRNKNLISDMEEERRLAYVAMTRARKKLYFCTAASRTLFGRHEQFEPSTFLLEVDENLIESEEDTSVSVKKSKWGNYYSKNNVSDLENNTNLTQYKEGVSVTHPKFGKGIILSAKPMGNDVLLEIGFDECGTKKIMAGFAKLVVNSEN